VCAASSVCATEQYKLFYKTERRKILEYCVLPKLFRSTSSGEIEMSRHSDQAFHRDEARESGILKILVRYPKCIGLTVASYMSEN
jgi:hypothetical protein